MMGRAAMLYLISREIIFLRCGIAPGYHSYA